MIEEPFVFLLILVVSLVLSHFLMSDRAGRFQWVAYRLFFIGVIIHEISHAIMCLMVGMKFEYIRIRWRDERFGFRSPHGSVKPDRIPTFLQAFVLALAPLYFSTWLIFLFTFGVVFNPSFEPLARFFAGVVVISCLLTAAPSTIDWRYISGAFRENPSHSWYQILLISLSIWILWFILISTHTTFFLDVFYYLAIAGIYLVLKFSLIGSRKLLAHISTRNYSKPSKVKMRPFTHKHYKPKKPPKRL
ncbi:MAG: hypothetical protein HWN81_02875 [Candidatus Lokiarchaeota archaeon]|nr:hypothetical protein [Candidatus Lokiarchaeota archaeon]